MHVCRFVALRAIEPGLQNKRLWMKVKNQGLPDKISNGTGIFPKFAFG
jgi:hypothetical protein